jgi:hypothetical protein
LHQQIKDVAFVVDRSPEPELPAGDQDCPPSKCMGHLTYESDVGDVTKPY